MTLSETILLSVNRINHIIVAVCRHPKNRVVGRHGSTCTCPRDGSPWLHVHLDSREQVKLTGWVCALELVWHSVTSNKVRGDTSAAAPFKPPSAAPYAVKCFAREVTVWLSAG